MNKKLIQRIQSIMSAHGLYDYTNHDVGVTNKGAQEIIKLCADEAIEAVINERENWQSGGMAELGIDEAINAIKKRMK